MLERLGIDYCCGGDQSLELACRKAGRETGAVIAALLEAERPSAPEPEGIDWRNETLEALTEHIERTHHSFMKRELPRAGELMAKVRLAHGERHPELAEMAAVLDGLAGEIGAHLLKEERVLFPMIRQMEATRLVGRLHCGSVTNPIAVMEHEHESAGIALRRLRELSRGYQPPEDACASYRALLDSLAGIERDLHVHIHKENNILHPRAEQLEIGLQAGAGGF